MQPNIISSTTMSFILFFHVLIVITMGQVQAQSPSEEWGKTASSNTEQTTTLEFYFHDFVTDKFPSAIKVAQTLNTDTQYPNGFGNIIMTDDMLTIGPDPNSKLVGRAQGLYGVASRDDFSVIKVMSYNFFDGAYADSSISIIGRNWVAHQVREMPIIGGTGVFRMARGYAIATTHWIDVNAGNAIVGYNVTVFH